MAHRYSRRAFLTTAAGVAAAFGVPKVSLAQTFPEKGKPIRGVVPFPPGSTADTLARPYAQAMGEILGTPVVIENRVGADGVVGIRSVKSAAPDGYTFLFTSLSTQVLNPHLFKELPYDPLKDFIPLAGTMRAPQLMNVGPSLSQFKSASEFFAAAKANPKKYTYASVSATTRTTGNMLARAAGIELVNVPYKNFGDLVSNMLAGKIDILMADAPAAKPYYSQGMRSLAVAALTRVSSLPEVPTLQEQGLKGFEVYGWHATYAPVGTPAPVVATLQDAVQKAARSKYVQDYFSNFGVEAFPLAGEELAKYQRAEYEKWGIAIREAGLTGTL